MTSVQGEFASAAQAAKAVEALKAAGAPADSIRQWNIVGPAVAAEPGTSARTAGAVAGGLTAGLPGALAGAAAGGVLDAVTAEGPHLPEPSGVRVVVDVSPACPDPGEILRSHGAANVHQG